MSETSAEAVPNQYIVVFKEHTPDQVCQEHREWAQAAHVQAAALRGESDGPELSGVGKTLSFPTWSGYVGRFSDALKSEIEKRDEVR
jgi:cerevisin